MNHQYFIELFNGKKLPYHSPRIHNQKQTDLTEFIPEEFKKFPLEIEIGSGKGEWIAREAKLNPNHFFLGIDRRLDRFRLTEKKLKRTNQQNWAIVREDARVFLNSKLPKINKLHIYQPDPWPKRAHHKHRFFRSPDAYAWAKTIKKGGIFNISTDNLDYYTEILDIIYSWKDFELQFAYQKKNWMGSAKTYFESIFLNKKLPIYKISLVKKL